MTAPASFAIGQGHLVFCRENAKGAKTRKGRGNRGSAAPGPTAPSVPPYPFRAFAPFAFSRQNAGQAFASRKLNGPALSGCDGGTGQRTSNRPPRLAGVRMTVRVWGPRRGAELRP